MLLTLSEINKLITSIHCTHYGNLFSFLTLVLENFSFLSLLNYTKESMLPLFQHFLHSWTKKKGEILFSFAKAESEIWLFNNRSFMHYIYI